jgi:hypothetical protein
MVCALRLIALQNDLAAVTRRARDVSPEAIGLSGLKVKGQNNGTANQT